MKPIKFPESNVTFGENQPCFEPLPAFLAPNGIVVSCWELSPAEIEKVRETGYIWLSQCTCNEPLQAVFMTAEKADVLTVNDDGKSSEASPQQGD